MDHPTDQIPLTDHNQVTISQTIKLIKIKWIEEVIEIILELKMFKMRMKTLSITVDEVAVEDMGIEVIMTEDCYRDRDIEIISLSDSFLMSVPALSP